VKKIICMIAGRRDLKGGGWCAARTIRVLRGAVGRQAPAAAAAAALCCTNGTSNGTANTCLVCGIDRSLLGQQQTINQWSIRLVIFDSKSHGPFIRDSNIQTRIRRNEGRQRRVMNDFLADGAVSRKMIRSKPNEHSNQPATWRSNRIDTISDTPNMFTVMRQELLP
jgi:hypothetical protein